jgi:hypothetical protein
MIILTKLRFYGLRLSTLSKIVAKLENMRRRLERRRRLQSNTAGNSGAYRLLLG